jgi:hypothetical protein
VVLRVWLKRCGNNSLVPGFYKKGTCESKKYMAIADTIESKN